MQPEVIYQLKAFVNGDEVYTGSSSMTEVIQMSLNDAEFAVGQAIDSQLQMHWGEDLYDSI